MSVNHPWGRKRGGGSGNGGSGGGDPPRRRAYEDPNRIRYAILGDVSYPVLLRSFLSETYYCEDVTDDEEYGNEWVRGFRWDIKKPDGRYVILAHDKTENYWEYESLWTVEEVPETGSALEVYLGKLIEPLARR